METESIFMELFVTLSAKTHIVHTTTDLRKKFSALSTVYKEWGF